MTFNLESLRSDYPYPKTTIDMYIVDEEGNKVKGGLVIFCSDTEIDVNLLQEGRNLNLTENSILLATFPRSGTTLSQYLLTALLNKGQNIDKIKRAKNGIYSFSPFFEGTHSKLPFSNCSYYYAKKLIQEDDHKFVIKTHLPRFLAPRNLQNSKTLICVRNPIDTYYSWYKFLTRTTSVDGKGFRDAKIDLETFVKMIREGEIRYGSYVNWYKSWEKEAKSNENVLIYHYEDIVKNPVKTIKTLAKFLDESISDSHLENILRAINLDSMKEIEESAMKDEIGKIRTGKIGDAIQYFSDELLDEIKLDLLSVDDIFGLTKIIQNNFARIDRKNVKICE